jgi:hypothetical protein
MVNQWLVKLMKESFVMVAPVKTAGLGSYGLHTDDRNSRAVFVKFTQHLFGYQPFSLQP